jgi:hypothetical protein
MNTNNFILSYDFDGNINNFLLAIHKGNAIQYNGISYPIKKAYSQGKQVVLPLNHKNIIIDLTEVYKQLKNNNIIKITLNIV